jgi:hypothetical protein
MTFGAQIERHVPSFKQHLKKKSLQSMAMEQCGNFMATFLSKL